MRKANPQIIYYNNKCYDITRFIHKHPGGSNSFKSLTNSDFADRFNSAPLHSENAMYLLNEYRVNEKISETLKENIKDSNENGGIENKNGNLANMTNGNGIPMSNGVLNGNLKKVDKIEEDESMEYLVDWTKPMIAQVFNMDALKYTEWVNKPVDRDLKFFSSKFLEKGTRTSWYVIPLVWIPVIISFIYTGWKQENSNALTNFDKLTYITFGLLFWTFAEYTLHRYIFHLNPTFYENKYLRTFHFLIHGCHHKVPFDGDRLVFPPVPAFILFSIFYAVITQIFTYANLVTAGFVLGYLLYDMTHYYLHYGSPDEGHLYKMKRYHYQHHFVHHDLGFGISSKIWDVIFNTQIFLRKLKYHLRW